MKPTWTLCDSSGEAFLTRGLTQQHCAVLPPRPPADAISGAGGRGEVEAQTYPMFPRAEEGWCETAHLTQPIGKLCTSSTTTFPHCYDHAACTPQTLQTALRLGEGLSYQQMLSTLRKPISFTISALMLFSFLHFSLGNK